MYVFFHCYRRVRDNELYCVCCFVLFLVFIPSLSKKRDRSLCGDFVTLGHFQRVHNYKHDRPTIPRLSKKEIYERMFDNS